MPGAIRGWTSSTRSAPALPRRRTRGRSSARQDDGRRSVATVRRSEKVSAATTAVMRGSSAAACSATAAPSEVPIRTTGPGCQRVDDATEILLLEEPVRARVAFRITVRATVVRDDIEAARHEALNHAGARCRDCRRCRADTTMVRACGWPCGSVQPRSVTPAPANSRVNAVGRRLRWLVTDLARRMQQASAAMPGSCPHTDRQRAQH